MLMNDGRHADSLYTACFKFFYEHSKFSLVSLLFVISRYGIICYNVLSIITLVPWSQAVFQYGDGTDGQVS